MAGTHLWDFDFRFPAFGTESSPLVINGDDSHATHLPSDHAATHPNPRQRSIPPTYARKKQKTNQEPNQPTPSPAPMDSSTDTPTLFPSMTAADLLAQILDLFPDISADYVTRLIEPLRGPMAQGYDLFNPVQFVTVKGTVIDQILSHASYPKQKRKRDTDAVEEKHEANRRKYLDHPHVEDKSYQSRILKILQQEFPLVPHHTIGGVIKEKKSLYSAYQELFAQEHVLEQTQRPYTRLKHARITSSDKKRQGIEAYKESSGTDDTIEELNAAKEAARLEANAIREKVDRELAEKLNEEEHVQLGRLVECKCCYGDVPSNRHITCDGADAHIFCFTCIRKSAETQIGLMKYQLRCMDESGCAANFARSELKIALDSALLDKLDALQQDDEVLQAKVTGLESCPFCDFKAICPPVEEDREFRCLNPACQIVSCRLCDLESHLPQTCEEVRRKERGLGERHQVEEAMSKAFIRTCPRCKVKIVKEDGCNFVVCSKCRCSMCYACQKNITKEGHGHSCRRDDDLSKEVDRAQNATIRKILKKDPTLKEEDLRVNRKNAPSPRYPAYNVNAFTPEQAMAMLMDPARPRWAATMDETDPMVPPPHIGAPTPATPQPTPHSMQTTPPDSLSFARSTPQNTAHGPETTQPMSLPPTNPLPYFSLDNNLHLATGSQLGLGRISTRTSETYRLRTDRRA